VAEDQCHTLPDPNQVLGIDFTASMLEIAQEKARKRRLPREFSTMTPGESVPEYASESVSFVCGDAMRLPLADGSADVVSIAFGIRNVTDAGAAMREFYRVLRPGGRVIVLEFSLPENRVLRGLYNFYFRKVLPRTATWISGDKSGAYQYLPESVNTFIGRDRMMGMMREAGFGDVRGFPLTFGVCVCYRGVK
ncbi:MAG: class I SAM-dependent methyltransferase, partial [Planctomycetota bacterium]|nr:class I SAM-dependent methyltransferase [Planctomycetota bacterium]